MSLWNGSQLCNKMMKYSMAIAQGDRDGGDLVPHTTKGMHNLTSAIKRGDRIH